MNTKCCMFTKYCGLAINLVQVQQMILVGQIDFFYFFFADFFGFSGVELESEGDMGFIFLRHFLLKLSRTTNFLEI